MLQNRLYSKKIYGYVIGADNKPAVGIRLVIADTKFFSITDKNGRYEITLDDKFDVSKNKLVVESLQYHAILTLDFSKGRQNSLKLQKAESMIMGKIMIAPKKK